MNDRRRKSGRPTEAEYRAVIDSPAFTSDERADVENVMATKRGARTFGRPSKMEEVIKNMLQAKLRIYAEVYVEGGCPEENNAGIRVLHISLSLDDKVIHSTDVRLDG